MQQYRVNYPLLIGLVVGTLVCSGAVYGLWRFQVERKSGWLIREAETAREAGDVRRAVEYYGQYLSIQNDDEIRIKYAQAFSELSKQDDITPQEFHMAWQALEGIVRDSQLGTKPEADELRLQLVKMYALMQRFPDALAHVEYLLEKSPKDEELHILKAAYLGGLGKFDESIKKYFELVGYNPQTETFDPQKAVAPHNVQVYSDLARLVRTRRDDVRLAGRIMDQLVEVNPDSAEAHLARGQFLNGLGDDDNAGSADIERAYELKPEDADVLINIAIQTARPGENAPEDEANAAFDKADEYLTTGKKLFPDDYRFYQVAADIEIRRKNYAAALAQVDEGLKKIGTKKASMLLLFKADLQLNEEDKKGVNDTIDDMKREGFRSEFIDWYEARRMLAEQQWFPAKEALSRLRPRVAEDPNPWPLNLRDIDFYLGLCYERLGLHAEALDQYQLVLDADPENESADAGKKRMTAALDPQSGQTDPFQQMLADIMKKPKDQQDWTGLYKYLDEQGEKRGLDETNKLIYRAQLMIMSEDYDNAAKTLTEALRLSPKNLTVHRLIISLARLNPKVGPERALTRLQKAVDDFGDQAALRIDKADILIALHKDNPAGLRAELASLAEGVDGWTADQKVELWSGLAARYLTLNMVDEARQYWTLSAELQPHELPLRLQLFQMALLSNDDAGMQDAQNKILQIVRDKDDSTWLYTEARRKLSQVKRGELGKEGLDEIRLLVNRALEARKDWHELYLVDAEVELVAGNVLKALAAFDEAAARGLPNQMAMAMHIDLLARAGRFADAAAQLKRLPEASRQSLLGPLYADILFRTNQVENALEQSRLATEKDPNNANNFYWYGQLLARYAGVLEQTDAKRKESLDKAVVALKRFVELQPESPDGWFFLINLYATQQNAELAQKTLRDAQLALVGDNLQIFLGKCYEALGRWFDAETMYRTVYETAPQEIPRAQGLAAFYLGQSYQQPDRVLKVTPLLNQIMRAGAEGKIEKNDANLHWARRMAAKILAASGEYQNLLKAEKLLASNSQGGELLVQDKLELAHILSARPEPASRKTAIALLEDVRKIQPLDARSEVILGELYFATGDWRTYENQMEATIARHQQSAAAREAYARKLIARGDRASIDKAVAQMIKLKELAPASATTFELTVRLANKLGKQAPARDELLRRQPKIDATTEPSRQLELAVRLFGGLFVELDDLDSAEKLYRALAARDPAKSYALAMFLGQHRNVDQCFEQLNRIYQPDRVADILGVALSVVREKRDQVGDKYDATVQGWLDRGLLDNPDSITLLMLQADLYDIQKRYSDAAGIYRKLLDRSELTGTRRAVVLNNLSFLVSLEGSAASNVDPLKLANEAAEILGPNSDILDTRAVAFMAKGQYSQAIADLQDAVTDNPTATKYFHLAEAYFRNGEKKFAGEAWAKAEELGLNKDVLNRMEHDKYESLKREIQGISRGGASVTRAEPRRAG